MSLLNTSIPRLIEPGYYVTRVCSFEEVNIAGRQPYVAVELDIDNMIVTDRWYSNRIPYIMGCLRKQFEMEYMDCVLSKLLNTCMKSDFVVRVSYHAKYGMQIDYREED